MTHTLDNHHRHSIRLKEHDYAQAGAYFVTLVCKDRACLFGEIVDDCVRLNPIGEIVRAQWLQTADIRREIELDAFVVMPNHLHGIVWILGDEGITARDVGAHPAGAERYGGVVRPSDEAVPPEAGAHGRAPLHVARQSGNVAQDVAQQSGNAPQDVVRQSGNVAQDVARQSGNAPQDVVRQSGTLSSHDAHDDALRQPGRAIQSTPPQVRTPFYRPPRSLGSFVAGFKAAATLRINQLRAMPRVPVWQRNYYERIVRNDKSLSAMQQYILDNPRQWTLDLENPHRQSR